MMDMIAVVDAESCYANTFLKALDFGIMLKPSSK